MSFFAWSIVSPVAVSYAMMIPVNAPVPDTWNGQADTTSQFLMPRSARVEAIIFAVTYCRFAVLTLIPPDSVGLM